MEIAGAILTLLVLVAPLIITKLKERDARKLDPDEQNRERKQEIAREIVHDDEVSANRSLDADMREYHRLFPNAGSNPQRSGSETSEDGPTAKG